MMKLLHDEIVAGFKRRGNTDRFARFQSYAIGKSTVRPARTPARSWPAIAV